MKYIAYIPILAKLLEIMKIIIVFFVPRASCGMPVTLCLV